MASQDSPCGTGGQARVTESTRNDRPPGNSPFAGHNPAIFRVSVKALPLLGFRPMTSRSQHAPTAALLNRLWSLIPSGGSLPESVWRAGIGSWSGSPSSTSRRSLAHVPGLVPGLDPLSLGRGLRRRPSRRGRRAHAAVGLQPRGGVQLAVDVGRNPRALRAVVVRGQRGRVAIQRTRLRTDRADLAGGGRRHLRPGSRRANHLHQPDGRLDSRHGRAGGRGEKAQPGRASPRHRRHTAARRGLTHPGAPQGPQAPARLRPDLRSHGRQLRPGRLRQHADDRARPADGRGRQLQRHHGAPSLRSGPAAKPSDAGGNAAAAPDRSAAASPTTSTIHCPPSSASPSCS